ncbi:unnamed protein product [Merluccius merluccius]
MAWPCITRACCINRFWSELDKADISVPLVFTKYSDVADAQRLSHRHHQHPPRTAESVAIETQPPHPGEQGEPTACAAAGGGGGGGGKDGSSSSSVTRQDFKAWRVRPEPSCKPRNEYHPFLGPFDTETQYQQDYKPWPIPRKGDHPWIPKASPPTTITATTASSAAARKGGSKKERAAAEAESGVEKSEMEEKVQEKELKEAVKKGDGSADGKPAAVEMKKEKKEEKKEEDGPPSEPGSAERKGRAAADALNRQIKEVVSTGSCYRNEFKAYKDVKPAKPFKASPQYKPPGEEAIRETSYSATFKGEQAKTLPTDNKLMERRRIRSLYNEPSKEAAKVDKPASRSKPKKTPTTTTGRMVKKSKEKQVAAGTQPPKKKSTGSSSLAPKPEGGVTKKSKEMSNRLAEAKQ